VSHVGIGVVVVLGGLSLFWLLRPPSALKVARGALECILAEDVKCVVDSLDPDEKAKLGLSRTVQEAVVREIIVPGYKGLPIVAGEGGIEGKGRLVAWWLPLKTKTPSRLFVGAVTDDGTHYYTSLSFLIAGLHRAEENVGRDTGNSALLSHEARFKMLTDLGFTKFYDSETGDFQEFRR
jgi:hypothetical protein